MEKKLSLASSASSASLVDVQQPARVSFKIANDVYNSDAGGNNKIAFSPLPPDDTDVPRSRAPTYGRSHSSISRTSSYSSIASTTSGIEVGPGKSVVSRFTRFRISFTNLRRHLDRMDDHAAYGSEQTGHFTASSESSQDEFDAFHNDGDQVSQALTYARSMKYRQTSTDQHVQEEEHKFGIMLDESDIVLMKREHADQKQVQKWIRFDMAFGFVVILNGVLEVLTVEDIVDSDSLVAFIIASVFLVLFILEWCMRWYYNPKGLRDMLTNLWTRFDFVIILFSILDLWLLKLLGAASMGALAVLRVARLVRLVRLLRLIRLAQELYILVRSTVQALGMLMWAVFLLGIALYIFGLLVTATIGQADDLQEDATIQEYWGSIGRSMLTLLQISTYDHAGTIVRYVTAGQHKMQWAVVLFIPCIAICSLGIFNLIVGVLLTTIMEVNSADKQFGHSTITLQRHQAVTRLRNILLRNCKNQISSVEEEPTLTRSWLLSCIHQTDDEELTASRGSFFIHQHLETAGVTAEDINAIFNEITSLHNHEGPIHVDDFILGCVFLQTEAHPLHVTHICANIKSMYERICALSEHIDASSTIINHAIDDVLPTLLALQESSWRNVPSESKDEGERKVTDIAEDVKQATTRAREKSFLAEQASILRSGFGHSTPAERALVHLDNVRQKKARMWASFDGVFILFVLFNGVAMGLDASKERKFQRNVLADDSTSADYIWAFLELCFCAVFSLELIFRTIMYYQCEEMNLYGAFLGFVPSLLFSMSRSYIRPILRVVPKMISDPYVAFDVLLVAFALIDNFILRFFFSEVKYLVLLRLFRAFRMLRMARLLYLFHELTALIESVFSAVPVVFWSMILLCGFVFMFTVLLDSTSMDCIQGSATLVQYWGSFGETARSLYGLVLFTDWGGKVKDLCSDCGWWLYFLLLAFVSITGFGLMNIVTGVVVQSAFHVVHGERKSQLVRTLAEMKEIIATRKDKMFKELVAIERDHDAAYRLATKSQLRNYFQLWRLSLSRHASQFSSETQSPVVDPEMIATRSKNSLRQAGSTTIAEIVQDIIDDWNDAKVTRRGKPIDKYHISARELQVFLEDKKLVRVLRRADMELISMVMLFQRLDPLGKGEVDSGEFIEGVQRMRQSVQGIDVARSKSTVRRLWIDCQKMESHAMNCFERFMDIDGRLRDVTIVGSDRPIEGDGEDLVEHDIERDLNGLNKSLQKANAQLRTKIARLTRRLENDTQMLESIGDVHARLAVGIEMLDKGDTMSVTSAEDLCD